MSTAKILIFDSGVGGLSIVDEIRRMTPGVELFFACDNAAFPYGTKSEHFLLERIDHVLKTLIRRIGPDIIVVACNTASTLILPQIRTHFTNPVVGVVPAIKPAAQQSKSKIIGLLATPGTVTRDYTAQLIKTFAADCRVIPVGTSELVHMAEQRLRGEPIDRHQLKAIIAPLFASSELDTVVLACTHFPLLQQELLTAAPRQVQWIDSGNAIARRVKSLLPSASAQSPPQHNPTALFTGQDDGLVKLLPGLAHYGFVGLEVINV